ncbi:MAG TPA: GNAT family N-acetyltransferase [Gemmatimonadaceae bacterium]|nr:GNAT family N-acetyltransferase [Gemmatimonadaceae bacterium]
MPQRLAPAATCRPAVDDDLAAMRAFVEQDLAATPYRTVADYFLRLASDGAASEARAIVSEYAGAVVGFALFGEVAGAIGTGRVHFVSVTSAMRLHAIGAALCEAAVGDLAANGARLVVAEVPDELSFLPGRKLLARCGFVEIGRVADYVRDSTDLVVLARSIDRDS